MFLRLFLVLFCVFAFNSEHASARSKKSSKKVAKTYQKSQSTKKTVGLRFEPNWYYSMKPKARKAYLNALSRLVNRAAGGRASLDENFLRFLIEKAYADDLHLNIGYIYDRENGSFDSFISNMNFTFMDSGTQRSLNQCPSGQNPCAIYTCMRQDSDGNPVLCCGTNSTPSCVATGNQSANRDALFEILERCRNSSTSLCSTVQRLLQSSTAGVDDWCDQGGRGSQGYCRQALAAIEAAGGASAPEESEAPAGANCEEVGDELARRHDRREPPRTEEAAANNNAFWRDMTYAARRVCGYSVREATERIGVCNVADMAAPGVGIQGTERVRTQRPSQLSGPAPSNRAADQAYETCIETRVNERMQSRHDREERELADRFGSIPDSEFNEQVAALRTRHNQERLSYETELRRNTNCTYTRPTTTAISGSPASVHDLPDGILGKVSSGADLTNTERNQFMAVTGMAPERFRQTFCAANHEAFSAALATNANRSPRLQINRSVQTQVDMEAAAQAAQQSMRLCQQRLLSPEESGCSYSEMTNVAGITRATNASPLMAKNRETNQCFLVVRHVSDRVYDRTNPITQEDETRARQRVFLDDLQGNAPVENMNPTEFGQRYELFSYSCTNSAPAPGNENPDTLLPNPPTPSEVEF